MKLVFCISGTINSGGMERILAQRANYFVEKFGYDISIITTDNNNEIYKDRCQFFYFNSKIKIIDLGIKYLDFFKRTENINFLKKQIKLKKLKNRHLKLLNKTIEEIKPDILISLGDVGRDIIYQVSFPCKKILENHFNKQLFTGEL